MRGAEPPPGTVFSLLLPRLRLRLQLQLRLLLGRHHDDDVGSGVGLHRWIGKWGWNLGPGEEEEEEGRSFRRGLWVLGGVGGFRSEGGKYIIMCEGRKLTPVIRGRARRLGTVRSIREVGGLAS